MQFYTFPRDFSFFSPSINQMTVIHFIINLGELGFDCSVVVTETLAEINSNFFVKAQFEEPWMDECYYFFTHLCMSCQLLLHRKRMTGSNFSNRNGTRIAVPYTRKNILLLLLL